MHLLLLGRSIIMSKVFFHCMGLQVCRVCMVDQLWLHGEFWSRQLYNPTDGGYPNTRLLDKVFPLWHS